MRLLFDLPEQDQRAVRGVIGDEEILYCIPSDLEETNRYSGGFSVVTPSRFVRVQDGEIAVQIPIAELEEVKATTQVGNGFLEATCGGESHRLARYTMTQAPRHATIARAMNVLHKGRTPKFISFDDERTCPTCGRTLPDSTRVCFKCTKKGKIAGRLLPFARPYWRLIILGFGFYGGVTAMALLVPRLTRTLIDSYIVPGRAEVWPIIGLVGAMAGATVLVGVCRIFRGRIMAKLGNGIERDLRQMVFTKIQALSLGYVSLHKTGNLMHRITHDTRAVQRFIAQVMSEMLNALVMIVAAVIIMALREWRLALLIFVPAPLVAVVLRIVFGRLIRVERRLWRLMDRAHHMLQDILSGIRVVKAFGREGYEIGRYRSASQEVRDLSEYAGKFWNSITPFFGFVFGLGQFLVLFYGGHLVLGERMALGELTQFGMYAGLIYGPLAWLSFLPRAVAHLLNASARIFEVVDEAPDVADRPHPVRMRIKGAVSFRNVTFGYHSHEPVLDEIDLEVQPGEMIGLVGHSGAGKSTMINLILRLYDVDEGSIHIDGEDVRDIATQDLRSQMGVVLQETFLFSGTVIDNIRYAKPEATELEVIRAAKIAHAHDFVVKFPNGYDTQVGERGHRLSGGEAQRIAIARAVIHNPRILILDEATSSVDTDTEQQIQDALDHLVKDRTTFAIAHRLATLRNANRLVVIEKGRIEEVGTHGELMEKKGIYHDLIRSQRRMAGARGL